MLAVKQFGKLKCDFFVIFKHCEKRGYSEYVQSKFNFQQLRAKIKLCIFIHF